MNANETPKDEAVREPEVDEAGRPVAQRAVGSREVPLFLRGISDGDKGNEQDEKDGIGE